MSIQKSIPFASPIWEFNIGNNFQNEVNTCYQIESTSISNEKSNVGGYQSLPINLKECFSDITNTLIPALIEIAKDIGMQFDIVNAWININRKNNFNTPHIHSDSAFSGVVYLKTNSNCGKIVFMNPTIAEAFPINSKTQHFWGTYFFQPKIGDVLVFPSYLKHYVEPNLSDEDRISIAFNMR